MKLSLFQFIFCCTLCIFGGACNSDSSTGGVEKPSFSEVESRFELGSCNVEREGITSYVIQERKYYICRNENWFSIENSFIESSSSIMMNEKSQSNFLSSSAMYSSNSINAKSSSSRYVIGSMTDSRNLKTYKTVTIGSQTWMAENLNYNYNIGSARSICCTYNGESYYSKLTSNSNNCSEDQDDCKLGRLYTWSAAVDSAALFSTDGQDCGCRKQMYAPFCFCNTGAKKVRGVCPIGWHLPGGDEWATLFKTIGGESRATGMLSSTRGWESGSNGYDYYEFSIYPSGVYHFDWDSEGNGFLEHVGEKSFFWNAINQEPYNNAYSIYTVFNGEETAFHSGYSDANGNSAFSVRCVKDSF